MPLDAFLDPSCGCLVLANDSDVYDTVLRRAVETASLSDGRSLVPVRGDPADPDSVFADETLRALEWGVAMIVDLVGTVPDVFRLVRWHARARTRSVLLLRRGRTALPFEVHELPVRPYEPSDLEGRPATRTRVATWASAAAAARADEGPANVRLTRLRDALAVRRRREQNGVYDALVLADRDVLEGNAPGALRAMDHALAAEPTAPDLLLRTALLLREGARYPEAAELLERAVRSAPARAACWRELGIARDRAGLPGAEDALRRAVAITEDYEALVSLALLCARNETSDDEPARLLERAIDVAEGQLNLVLPALVHRAGREGRIRLTNPERERVLRVLEIRAGQALGDPAEDAPWSHFDAARAHLLLGDGAAALAVVSAARPHLHAAWNADTFARSLDALERAGAGVGPLREVLGLRARTVRTVGPVVPVPPRFTVAARPPAWFAENVPCMAACPVGTDAGAYVHHLAEGRYAEAFHAARAPNPFASVCARVCAAPCEDACRRGRVDEPVAIRPLKRFLTERFGAESPDNRVGQVLAADRAPCIEGEAYGSHLRKMGGPAPGTGPKVVIVGGGPAGLACAHDLALLGYRPTVFEASNALGGMIRHGIPVYRLPRELIDREIDEILRLGVEVRLECALGRDRTLESLLASEYEAAFLASGAGRGRFLDVEGADLDGVVRAIEYLINVNRGYKVELGQRVVVVGGGNVALDVARTARRGRPPADAGAGRSLTDLGGALPTRFLRSAFRGDEREVHVVARQPMGGWPAERSVHGAEELMEARREGVVFHPLRGVRRIRGEDGRVAGVELAEVVQIRDASGRYAPSYGAHAAESIACDTVVLAVGQEPELDYLEGTRSLARTKDGLVEVDRATLATSLPGVFAGGDAAFGPRTLIEAVADGKRAARGIHAFLRSAASAGPPARHVRFTEVPPRAVPTEAGYDAIERVAPPSSGLDRRTGIAEVESGYDEAEARRQAARCLVCHVQTVYDGSRCIACGRCTDVCPYACLSFVRPDETDLQGIDPRAVGGAPAEAVYLVKDEDRCIRCGLCAERCPTGAMTMERLEMSVAGVGG